MALFLFCFLGDMVTIRSDMFNETLCNTDWYLFPIELQRMMAIFMATVQQPTTVGNGSAVFNREAFKKVCVVLNAFVDAP